MIMRLIPTEKQSMRMPNLRAFHTHICSWLASSGSVQGISTQHQQYGHLEFIGVFWWWDKFSAFQVKQKLSRAFWGSQNWIGELEWQSKFRELKCCLNSIAKLCERGREIIFWATTAISKGLGLRKACASVLRYWDFSSCLCSLLAAGDYAELITWNNYVSCTEIQ